MRFPNAYNGVKKLFIAEIVSVIATFIALTSGILAAIAASGVAALIVPAATLVLISGIAMIVVFIMQLIGLVQGGKDSPRFRTGLIFVLIGLAFGFVSSILQSIEATKGLTILIDVFNTVSTLANFFVILCVLYGISTLLDELGQKEAGAKGRRLASYVTILYTASIILGLLQSFEGPNTQNALKITFAIIAVIALVLELVVYINVVIYLGKSAKMLKE